MDTWINVSIFLQELIEALENHVSTGDGALRDANGHRVLVPVDSGGDHRWTPATRLTAEGEV